MKNETQPKAPMKRAELTIRLPVKVAVYFDEEEEGGPITLHGAIVLPYHMGPAGALALPVSDYLDKLRAHGKDVDEEAPF